MHTNPIVLAEPSYMYRVAGRTHRGIPYTVDGGRMITAQNSFKVEISILNVSQEKNQRREERGGGDHLWRFCVLLPLLRLCLLVAPRALLQQRRGTRSGRDAFLEGLKHLGTLVQESNQRLSGIRKIEVDQNSKQPHIAHRARGFSAAIAMVCERNREPDWKLNTRSGNFSGNFTVCVRGTLRQHL